jgi:DNA-binding transcriptional MerR regulator
VDARWTLTELVAEVASRIAALPAPKNGQVRAVPDERTVRYYGTIGLLSRPGAMRGRTALYGDKHVAQVVAIKRLQAAGRSLSEIQTLWSTLDDAALSRMSGVVLRGAAPTAPTPARGEFWKRTPSTSPLAQETIPTMTVMPRSPSMPVMPNAPTGPTQPRPIGPPSLPDLDSFDAGDPVMGVAAVFTDPPDDDFDDTQVRIKLAPNVVITVALSEHHGGISRADIEAFRDAAAPLIIALAERGLLDDDDEYEAEEE